MPRKTPGLIAARAAYFLAIPLLVFAAYDTLRLAAADADFRDNTPDSLARAVRLEPGNAQYHELLAEHLEGENRDAGPDREAAARLSPLESRYWIGLGIRDEANGDLAGAERNYLHAAEADRMFTPRWTLMNYYFRRQNQARFWIWAKRALEMGYENQYAAYRLMWLMTDDPRKVEQALPPNKELKRNYLDFLLDTQRFDDLSPVDREVAEAAGAEDVPNLLYYCERAIGHNTQSAVTVWNILIGKKLEPFAQLSTEKGSVVTDGTFRINPIEHGFDWYVPATDGAQTAMRASGPGMEVQLTGDQPENCILLDEIVPLVPGADYRMRFAYSSEAASDASGLAWQVGDPVTGSVFGKSETLKLNGQEVTDQAEFTAGERTAGRLALRYSREPGTVRHEESVRLRNIAIERIDGKSTQ